MRALTLLRPLNANLRKRFYSVTETIGASAETIKNDKPGTIDTKEVEHHTNLSKQWWDLGGPMKALHSMNSLRVQFVRDGLANTGVVGSTACLPLEGVKILDVGCGGGILAEPLVRIGADVTGIDASLELIKTASEHATLDSSISERLRYVNTSIEEHCENTYEKYDAVVASEILEHVDNRELFLKCCIAATKPGGSLFLTTLNKTTLSWLGGIIAAEYILKLVPAGTHSWKKFISPNETRRLIESYDCQTKLIHGMCYNPLKNEWSWTSSTAINYALHAVKKGKLAG